MHARCPMHTSIAKIGPIVDKLIVNGTEVSLWGPVAPVPSECRRTRPSSGDFRRGWNGSCRVVLD